MLLPMSLSKNNVKMESWITLVIPYLRRVIKKRLGGNILF